MKKRMWIIPTIVFLTTFFALKSAGGGCADGWQSPSIGIQGACSHHGGVAGGGLTLIAALLLAGYSFYRLDKAEAARNRRAYEASRQQEWFRLDLTSAPFNPQEHYTISGNLLTHTYLASVESEPECVRVTVSEADAAQIEKLAHQVACASPPADQLVLDGLDVTLRVTRGGIQTFQALQIDEIDDLGDPAVSLLAILEKQVSTEAVL